jgi:hypothetical protein
MIAIEGFPCLRHAKLCDMMALSLSALIKVLSESEFPAKT